MKLAIVLVAVLLTACNVKLGSGGGGGNDTGGGEDPNKPKTFGEAKGTLHGTPFKPVVAAVKRSETSSDSRDYYWVRMTDIAVADPCTQISGSDRFVGFYIPQAGTIGTFDMNVRRGMTHGAIFFHNSGGYKVDWITQGWANVFAFDKSTGVDVVMEIGSGSNTIEGVVHAQFCP